LIISADYLMRLCRAQNRSRQYRWRRKPSPNWPLCWYMLWLVMTFKLRYCFT